MRIDMGLRDLMESLGTPLDTIVPAWEMRL